MPLTKAEPKSRLDLIESPFEFSRMRDWQYNDEVTHWRAVADMWGMLQRQLGGKMLSQVFPAVNECRQNPSSLSYGIQDREAAAQRLLTTFNRARAGLALACLLRSEYMHSITDYKGPSISPTALGIDMQLVDDVLPPIAVMHERRDQAAAVLPGFEPGQGTVWYESGSLVVRVTDGEVPSPDFREEYPTFDPSAHVTLHPTLKRAYIGSA